MLSYIYNYIYKNVNIYTNITNVPKDRHYIYLLIEREFINSGEHIYKIGKTTQDPIKRFNQYPKGSKLILIVHVSDCHENEKKIIDLFDNNFERCPNIGREYYKSNNVNMMITLIMNNVF